MWLAPAPVVARVSMTLGPERGIRSLEDELAFAAHAVSRGAPVVPPAREVPPGPHLHDGLLVSFWEHVEAEGELDEGAAGRGLRALHDAVAGFERELPRFDRLDEAERVLDSMTPAEIGTEDDLAAIRHGLGVARSGLDELELDCRPIHGDAHLGNVIQTASGPLWADLENVCAGPVEYDLACLAWRERVHAMPVGGALDAYGPHDEQLVEDLMPALGVFLAVWTIEIVRRLPTLAGAKYVGERLAYVRELR